MVKKIFDVVKEKCEIEDDSGDKVKAKCEYGGEKKELKIDKRDLNKPLNKENIQEFVEKYLKTEVI